MIGPEKPRCRGGWNDEHSPTAMRRHKGYWICPVCGVMHGTVEVRNSRRDKRVKYAQ